MATGTLQDGLLIHLPPGISMNLQSLSHFPDGSPSLRPDKLQWDVYQNTNSGVRTGASPSAGVHSLSGTLFRTFDGDLYDRIHVIPISHNLGNVLQSQSRTAEVWNAYPANHTLNAIIETLTTGVLLSGGPGAPPKVFGPLRSWIYTFAVSIAGPTIINAGYLFDFDSEDVSFTLTGTRAVVFAFEPQWPVSEFLEWKTDVLESYGGAEQRVMIRHSPRQKIAYTYLMPRVNDVSRAINTLYGQVGGVFGIPVWWDLRSLTADVSIGASVIPTSTANADFRNSGFAILWRSATDFEVVEITSFTGSQLNLTRPTDFAHPALTTIVMPIQVCLIDDQIPTNRRGNGVTTIEANWVSQNTTDISATDGELTLYRSMPVLNDLNFMSGDTLSETIFTDAVLVDNETSAGATSYRRRFPRVVTAKGWQPETNAELWAIRKLLYALRGRQRSFWLPSFREDFVLAATIAPADVSILVNPVDYELNIDTEEPFGDIAIYLTNGSVFFREITNVQPGAGGTERLDFVGSLGVTVLATNVLRISYLVRSRIDSDSVQIDHQGIGRAVIEIPVVGVLP